MKNKKIIYAVVGVITITIFSCFIFCKITHKADVPYAGVSPKHAYNENMVVIDIRPKDRCLQTGKAKGSHSIPISDSVSPKEYLEKVREIAKGNTIAFMCNMGRSSSMVTQQDRELFNAKDVTSINGGMEGSGGWLDENLPTEPCSQ